MARILVVGATGGIGGALARTLVGRGDAVLLAARGEERLAALGASLGQPWRSGDVLDPSTPAALVAAASDKLGGLDGVAFAVGSIRLRPAHLVSDAEWDEVLALNLTAAFRVVRAAIPVLRAGGGGSVVLFSSVAAALGLSNHEAVAAAKAGLEGFARAAAATYAAAGIRINVVAPGLTDTPLAAPLLRSDASRAASEAMHPTGRIGRPEEVAEAAAFLLSPTARSITGIVVPADGGMGRLRPPPRVGPS
jgi:NAD(P)-dependent dehydrogenase (short-subunit alcohol dehydrogenase family)